MKPVPTSIRSRKKYFTKMIRRFVRKDVLVFVSRYKAVNCYQYSTFWQVRIWDRNERPYQGIHVAGTNDQEFIADVAWAVAYGPKSRWTNEEVEKMLDGVDIEIE